MGFSVFDCPRIIYCGEDIDNYISIPRGCFDELSDLLNEANIEFKVSDERNTGRVIDVSFKGELYTEQKKLSIKCLIMIMVFWVRLQPLVKP